MFKLLKMKLSLFYEFAVADLQRRRTRQRLPILFSSLTSLDQNQITWDGSLCNRIYRRGSSQ